MAGLRKLRTKWYARIYLWDGYQKTEKQVPLKTESKSVARERLLIVNRYEDDIKNGMVVEFPWQNDTGVIKYIKKTLSDVYKIFISSRQTLGLAKSTIKRNTHSLTLFSKVISKSIPIESITTKHIETFKSYCIISLKHAPQGININLRLLKTFFRWCLRERLIETLPDVQMIKIPQSLPSYITDFEWAKIINSNLLSGLDKQIFYFARETGCRLSEPFHGEIDGHWLIIPAIHTKSKIEREIFLSDELIAIWCEMKNALQAWLDNGRKIENFTGKISKKFLITCRSVRIIHHFNDMRHTFAVRRYLLTRDIYQVKKELGHSSVTTTEKYAKFSLRRLAHDFPSLTNLKDNSAILPITDTDFTDTQHRLSTVRQ